MRLVCVVTAQAKNTGHETDPAVAPPACNTSDPTQFCTSDVPEDVTPPTFGLNPDVDLQRGRGTTECNRHLYGRRSGQRRRDISDLFTGRAVRCFSIGSTQVICTATDAAGNIVERQLQRHRQGRHAAHVRGGPRHHGERRGQCDQRNRDLQRRRDRRSWRRIADLLTRKRDVIQRRLDGCDLHGSRTRPAIPEPLPSLCVSSRT